MKRFSALPLAPALLLVLAEGCASVPTLTTARTLDKGEVVYEFGAVAATDLGRDLFTRGPSAGPQVLAGVRRGMADGVDAGYRLWLAGMSADAKVRLVEKDDWAVAVAPGVGIEKTYAFYGLDLYVPLLVEKTLTEDVDLYAAPKALARVSLGHGSQLDVAAGASVGVAIWMNDDVSLLPELTALWPAVMGDDPCGLQLGPKSASCLRPGAPVVAAAIGVQLRK